MLCHFPWQKAVCLAWGSLKESASNLPGEFLAVTLTGQIVLTVSVVSQGLEVKALPPYLFFLCSIQIYVNIQNFDGFSLCQDCEILYCPCLYADHMGPQELHFEFTVLSQDRKPAKQQTDLPALKSFTVPDTSSLSFC